MRVNMNESSMKRAAPSKERADPKTHVYTHNLELRSL